MKEKSLYVAVYNERNQNYCIRDMSKEVAAIQVLERSIIIGIAVATGALFTFRPVPKDTIEIAFHIRHHLIITVYATAEDFLADKTNIKFQRAGELMQMLYPLNGGYRFDLPYKAFMAMLKG